MSGSPQVAEDSSTSRVGRYYKFGVVMLAILIFLGLLLECLGEKHY